MMGLPEGHVTDVPGVSRVAQLKMLGNGIVWQQMALALRLLLDMDAQPVGSSATLPTPNAGDAKQTGDVANWTRRQAEHRRRGANLQEPLAVAVGRLVGGDA